MGETVTHEIEPLDPSLYAMGPDTEQLFKAYTGINDAEDLKAHILKVQKDAYEVHPYMCIKLFTFTRLQITELPMYEEALRLGKTRKDSILLEIGPGLGSEVRKIVFDGFPAENIVATDLNPGLWDVGHTLFRSDSQSFPVKFVPGDIFDGFDPEAAPSPTRPDLHTLQELSPLTGHVSVIVLQLFFHLFGRERQHLLARHIAALLSPVPGSLMMGRQAGDTEDREIFFRGTTDYLHSPETWEKMWSEVFPSGTVEYHSELREIPQDQMVALGQFDARYWLFWSIKRL